MWDRNGNNLLPLLPRLLLLLLLMLLPLTATIGISRFILAEMEKHDQVPR